MKDISGVIDERAAEMCVMRHPVWLTLEGRSNGSLKAVGTENGWQSAGESVVAKPVNFEALVTIVLALSQYRLGNTKQAQLRLVKADALIAAKLLVDDEYVDSDWHDTLMRQVARREAEVLIEERTNP